MEIATKTKTKIKQLTKKTLLSISIGSAVFAQLTAEIPCTLQ